MKNIENCITYTKRDGVLYPDLELPEQPEVYIGKYGQMWLDFLKRHCRGTYTTLLTEGRLTEVKFQLRKLCLQRRFIAIRNNFEG